VFLSAVGPILLCEVCIVQIVGEWQVKKLEWGQLASS
jgi:hypothetical protein